MHLIACIRCASDCRAPGQAFMEYITQPHAPGSIPRLDYLQQFHFYGHPYRAERFTRHIYGQKAISSITKQLLADILSRTLIGWGDGGQGPGRFIKGTRGPAKKVLKALCRACTVVSISEFRTSKCCAECGHVMEGRRVEHVNKGVRQSIPC